MKVKVTVENLETGEKDSVICDGAMAYVKVGNKDHVLALENITAWKQFQTLPMLPCTAL